MTDHFARAVQESFQLPGIRGRSRVKVRSKPSLHSPPRSATCSASRSPDRSCSPASSKRPHKQQSGKPSISSAKTRRTTLPAIAADTSTTESRNGQNVTLMTLPTGQHDDKHVDPAHANLSVEFEPSAAIAASTPEGSFGHQGRPHHHDAGTGMTSCHPQNRPSCLTVSSLCPPGAWSQQQLSSDVTAAHLP